MYFKNFEMMSISNCTGKFYKLYFYYSIYIVQVVLNYNA